MQTESIFFVIMACVSAICAEITDRFAIPARLHRSAHGVALRILPVLWAYAVLTALSGSPVIGATLPLMSVLALVIGSNTKYRILGEPLVFSDLVVVRSFIMYPRFYVEAISLPLRCLLLVSAVLIIYLVISFSSPDRTMAAAGLSLALASTAGLLIASSQTRKSTRMSEPALEHDIATYGLFAVLIIYWLRWRQTRDHPAPAPVEETSVGATPHSIVIVQCESFAQLTAQLAYLPGLSLARHRAIAWGNLEVSGFGAYTMRTEFGVLCGIDEEALGLRRYDPFLTAGHVPGHSLPVKLAALYPQSFFLHPHDLRFYDRIKLMPRLGFQHLIGENHFPPAEAGSPYVSDREIGHKILSLVDQASEPTLIYAVTMENHGPWDKGRAGQTDGISAWAHHVRNSDKLLNQLVDGLDRSEQSSLLIFFGDHRPTIPGHIAPGRVRHTPYVALQFPAGGEHCLDIAETPSTRTPAELHQLILNLVSGIEANPGSTVA